MVRNDLLTNLHTLLMDFVRTVGHVVIHLNDSRHCQPSPGVSPGVKWGVIDDLPINLSTRKRSGAQLLYLVTLMSNIPCHHELLQDDSTPYKDDLCEFLGCLTLGLTFVVRVIGFGTFPYTNV